MTPVKAEIKTDAARAQWTMLPPYLLPDPGMMCYGWEFVSVDPSSGKEEHITVRRCNDVLEPWLFYPTDERAKAQRSRYGATLHAYPIKITYPPGKAPKVERFDWRSAPTGESK